MTNPALLAALTSDGAFPAKVFTPFTAQDRTQVGALMFQAENVMGQW